MFTSEVSFAAFADLMDRELAWRDPALTFPRICRILGVPPGRFDRFLFRELGFHGEEILARYRQCPGKKAE